MSLRLANIRLFLAVTATILAVVLPFASFAQGGSQVTHVVAWGETLSSIAWRYGTSAQSIMAANDIRSPNLIYIGQKLVIPPPDTEPQSTATPAPEPASQPQGPITHTVAFGDTLSGIAWRYGVAPADLAAANDITNYSFIYIGQRLVIPTGPVAPGEETNDPPAESQPTPAPPPPPTSDAGPFVHVVQRGENLSRIAWSYGVSLDALKEANDIENPNLIHAGLRLIIPPAGVAGPSPAAPAPTITSGKQIIAVLSQQRVYAYEDGALVKEFLVSSGLPGTPTVQGEFAIRLKIAVQRMTGSDYDVPNVPWVSYFFEDYSFHGTYWHNNFGQPMSHGCVNMRIEDAKWIYDWAPLGTPVLVME